MSKASSTLTSNLSRVNRKARGKNYVYASELYDHPGLYGRSPRNRISEARTKAGHQIAGEPYGSSDWRYWLIQLNPSPPPRRVWAKHARKAQPSTESRDWYEGQHGSRPSAPETGLGPLFAVVRS